MLCKYNSVIKTILIFNPSYTKPKITKYLELSLFPISQINHKPSSYPIAQQNVCGRGPSPIQ